MHLSTSPKRKSFSWIAALSTLSVGLVAFGAFAVGVTPAQAASFATQPDTQVAVFMVPLTLLVLVLLFEVTRFVWRGTLPAQAPTPAPRPTNWARVEDQA